MIVCMAKQTPTIGKPGSMFCPQRATMRQHLRAYERGKTSQFFTLRDGQNTGFYFLQVKTPTDAALVDVRVTGAARDATNRSGKFRWRSVVDPDQYGMSVFGS
jgi:hypothetical protein